MSEDTADIIKAQCAHFGGALGQERCLIEERDWSPRSTPTRCPLCPDGASRPAPTVEAVAARLMAVCERLANTPMGMSLGDWGECSVVMREAASTISALVAERDEARDAKEREAKQARLAWESRMYWFDAANAENVRAITAESALATANARIAELEKALGEFAEPRNWVVNGRFDPHSGNFDATTFARAALTGGEDA